MRLPERDSMPECIKPISGHCRPLLRLFHKCHICFNHLQTFVGSHEPPMCPGTLPNAASPDLREFCIPQVACAPCTYSNRIPEPVSGVPQVACASRTYSNCMPEPVSRVPQVACACRTYLNRIPDPVSREPQAPARIPVLVSRSAGFRAL